MGFWKNIPFIIFLAIVAAIFLWQWKKSRRLHRQFMDQPEQVGKIEESKLHLDPVRNAYVRPQSKWFVIAAIGATILLFILLGLQKAGILK